MPELPEVEVTRLGLLPCLVEECVERVEVRSPTLRYPVPADLESSLKGRKLRDIRRRGKYLLFDFRPGTLIVHLGMSGSLRLVPLGTVAARHDHLDLVFRTHALRLHDPRRFGVVLWHLGDAAEHPLIAPLGLEPFSDDLTPEWLVRAVHRRRAPIKQILMDSHTLVGIGNIYASESLFHARIRPLTAGDRLGRQRCARLIAAIRSTLEAAVEAGGSTLRDFARSDGSPGYFQQHYFVYDRAGEPCRVCGTPIRALRLGQRSTFYCPRCQR
jgi:formamidopyrimidine-DNA glycosylase